MIVRSADVNNRTSSLYTLTPPLDHRYSEEVKAGGCGHSLVKAPKRRKAQTRQGSDNSFDAWHDRERTSTWLDRVTVDR